MKTNLDPNNQKCANLDCQNITKPGFSHCDEHLPDVTKPTQLDSLRQQLIADLEKYKSFGTPFTEDMADHIISMFKSPYAPKPDETVASILYTYKNGYDDIECAEQTQHEKCQTEAAQKLEAALLAWRDEAVLGVLDEIKKNGHGGGNFRRLIQAQKDKYSKRESE